MANVPAKWYIEEEKARQAFNEAEGIGDHVASAKALKDKEFALAKQEEYRNKR